MADDARSELDRLRAEYRQARSRVTRKINSTRRRNGARLAGSEYDPRRAVGHEKRLNRTQLEASIRNMAQFTDRRTQFVAGSMGTPLPKAKVDAFNELQSRFNRQRDWIGRNIDGQNVPGTEMTYKQARERFVEPVFPTRTPLSKSTVEPRSITNEKALDTLSRRLERRMTPEGRRREIKSARKVLHDMAEFGNDGSLMKRFENLSDEGILRVYSVVYFHNLKFDGTFIIDMLLNQGYEWTDNRVLRPKEFSTLYSNSGIILPYRIPLRTTSAPRPDAVYPPLHRLNNLLREGSR